MLRCLLRPGWAGRSSSVVSNLFVDGREFAQDQPSRFTWRVVSDITAMFVLYVYTFFDRCFVVRTRSQHSTYNDA